MHTITETKTLAATSANEAALIDTVNACRRKIAILQSAFAMIEHLSGADKNLNNVDATTEHIKTIHVIAARHAHKISTSH